MDLKDLLNNPEQIKNLITVLQSLLPNEQQEQTKENIVEKTENEPSSTDDSEFNTRIKTKGKRSSKSFINKFEKMSEFNMHKDDIAIDEKLSKHPPVARSREYDPISVTCRVCGKKENVNPSLVHDSPARYKCNSCSTNAG